MRLYIIFYFTIIGIHFTKTNLKEKVELCILAVIREYFRGEVIRIYGVEEICQESNGTRTAFLHSRVCFDLSGISTLEATFQVATSDFHTSERIRNIFVLTTNEDSEGLNKITTTMKMTSYWDTRVLVVLIGGNGPRTLIKIFDDIWKKTRLLNTVIMATDEEGNFTLYSWYPYERGHCEIVENLHVIDKCGLKGFENGKFIFTKRRIAEGLNGCPIRLSVSATDFFAMFKGIPEKYNEGLDFKIIYELLRKYDMEEKYVLPPTAASHWFRTHPNGSLRGTMKLLFDYKSDVGFSGLRITMRTLPILTFSHVYFLDSVRWAVPREALDEGWRKLLGIFGLNLWLLVIITIILCSAFSYLLAKFIRLYSTRNSFSYCLLEIFGITLNQPSAGMPITFKFRCFIICYSLYSMNIATSFQSHLIGILTAPLLRSPYSSVEAILRHGLTMYILPFDETYYRNDPIGEKILNSKQHRVMKEWVKLVNEVVFNKTAAMLVGDSRIKHLLATKLHDGKGKPLADFIPEKVSTNLLAFHLSPNNPLKDLFDDVIMRLLQAGLIDKWRNDLWTPKGIGHDDSSLTKPLNIKHLKFVFQLYGLTAVLSCLVLVSEILFFRAMKSKSPNQT